MNDNHVTFCRDQPHRRWADDLGALGGGLATWSRRELHDARFWQIAALTALLLWNIANLSVGAGLLPSLIAVAASLATQAVATVLVARHHIDLRSPLITGLSLSLLLRGDALWVPALAAVVAITSKFLIRINGKHLFNPAAFGIVVLLASGHAWVSPGQWGQTTLLIAGLVFLAILVLARADRLDIAIAFLTAYAALLAARAGWLGDPVAIPLHQLQNGALLIFTFFMITDPRSTPDARSARLLFALGCAGIAHWLLFAEQVRPALYVALLATSFTVPLLDRVLPEARFTWR